MYLALYRKYRSKSFDEVISQEHITTTLKNQIISGKPAHAYLFTGSRGTGKTTCAKLMARAVNCLSPVDGSPCGECEVCRAIADGCPDIIEMDAASNNGVDDVRALRDEVMYTPVVCRYKVYIIDEVHMMSGAAFNALLKTIEEPPAHVIFILATTEIHKVPATIVSRCQQFRFRRIAVEDSTKRLCEIARNEGVQLEVSAAELISRLSDGGMRDAVSLLDQCISVSEHIDEQVVRDTAGVAGAEHLIALADCIRAKDTAGALKILDELHNASKDLVLLIEEMTGHFRNLCILSSMNMDFTLIPPGSGDKNELARQTREFSQGEIMRCIDILQESSTKAPRSAVRKTLAEMCFVRLCTPRLDSDTAALSLRLEKLEKMLDGKTLAPIQNTDNIRNTAVQSIVPPKNEETVKAAEKPTAKPPKVKADKPASPQTEDSEVPSWLFEGGGGISPTDFNGDTQDSGYPDYSEPQAVIPEEPVQQDDEIPPFDLDDEPGANAYTAPEIPTIPEPPAYQPPQETMPAPDKSPAVSDGTWAEIEEQLPAFLQVMLRQVSVAMDGRQIVVSNYTPFHYEFLKKGDSIARIQQAAKDITGTDCRLIFDEAEQEQSTDKNDPLSDFLERAEKAGVKIKHKTN